MIESNAVSWGALGLLIAVASICCIAISRRLPWSDTAMNSRLNVAFGIALSPFLVGMVAIALLGILPGYSHSVHFIVLLAALSIAAIFCLVVRRTQSAVQSAVVDDATGLSLLQGGVIIWGGLLLVNAIFLPLTANDPLEYATVGRELYAASNLAIYPLLNPEATISGFYGPWTHPPLYVALIYLMSVLQGHADAPGLMRLIAPWFLLSSTGVIVALGCFKSRAVGWLSGFLYLSTPLLFIGASGAMIDALPVSALVLLMAAMVGMRQKFPAYPIIVGAVLGVGLWTHSQAILLIPLLATALIFQHGIQPWGRLAKSLLISLVVALVVGGGWYVRNWIVYGSPISDNPQVFALPELDWKGYFSAARGLGDWVALLQYGVFKGWFVFGAYGALFWLCALGTVFFLLRQRAAGILQVLRSGVESDRSGNDLLWIAVALLLAYFTGVVVSVALGIDLMTRNDRYLLIVVSPAAFLAAYFLNLSLSKTWSLILASDVLASTKNVVLVGYWLVGLLVIVQTVTVGWHYLWRMTPSSWSDQADAVQHNAAADSRISQLLDYWPSIRLHRALDQYIPEGALVLALRPADMYYANRKMVSFLDPRLLAFYLEKSPHRAANMLKEMGIDYVLSPDYSSPPVYNSSLMAILSNPELSQLVTSSSAVQLFKLEKGGGAPIELTDLTPGSHPWTQSLRTGVPGLHRVLKARPFRGGESGAMLPIFQRHYSTMLSTGSASDLGWGEGADSIPVEPGEHSIQLRVSGEGYLRLWLAEFDSGGSLVGRPTSDSGRPVLIGDFPLTQDRPQVNFERRLKFGEKTRFIRIGVEHQGKSRVWINKLTLHRLQ